MNKPLIIPGKSRNGKLIAIPAIAFVLAVAGYFAFFEPHPQTPPTKIATVQRTIPEAPSTIPENSIPASVVEKQDLTQTPSPAKVAALSEPLFSEFVAKNNPVQALNVLKSKYHLLQNNPASDARKVMLLCDAIAEEWPKSPEALKSLLLKSQCLEAVFDFRGALREYIGYAQAMGNETEAAAIAKGVSPEQARLRGDKARDDLISSKAERLFYDHEKGCLVFLDYIINNCADEKKRNQALEFMGKYNDKYSKTSDAIEFHRQVIKTSDDPSKIHTAYIMIFMLQDGRGKKDEAMSTLDAMVAHLKTDEAKAEAMRLKGYSYYNRGPAYFSKAKQIFEEFVKAYPNDNQRSTADFYLQKLNANSVKPPAPNETRTN